MILQPHFITEIPPDNILLHLAELFCLNIEALSSKNYNSFSRKKFLNMNKTHIHNEARNYSYNWQRLTKYSTSSNFGHSTLSSNVNKSWEMFFSPQWCLLNIILLSSVRCLCYFKSTKKITSWITILSQTLPGVWKFSHSVGKTSILTLLSFPTYKRMARSVIGWENFFECIK